MRVILFSIMILSSIGQAFPAETKKPATLSSTTPTVPVELKKMLEEFNKAINANDKAKASALSEFPLKNLVFREKDKKSKKDFEADLKGSTFGFCYGTKTPEKDTESANWLLDCNGILFYFGNIKGQWKYLGQENINE